MKFFIEYNTESREYSVYVKTWLFGRKKLISENFDSKGCGVVAVYDRIVTPYLYDNASIDFLVDGKVNRKA